jgi:enoyl-CoA hydratase/carnithine racemase
MPEGSVNHGDRVTLTVDGPVAEVRLVRPDKHNALDDRMFAALSAVGAELGARTDVRAVVLSGEGPSFCAGLDLTYFGPKIAEGVFDDLGERSHGDANLFQHVALVWRDLRVPVIAALQGSVFGGGLQIALGADIRHAAPDARLSIMETRWGLVPDMAGMVLLRRLVRDDVLRDLVYSARIVRAAEARELGLVTQVCDDPRSEALNLAHRLAAQSPRAVQAAKRLINGMADLDRAALLQKESAEQAPLLGGPDQIEAMRAQVEGRPPEYAD